MNLGGGMSTTATLFAPQTLFFVLLPIYLSFVKQEVFPVVKKKLIVV